jgi:hypothetical protein
MAQGYSQALGSVQGERWFLTMSPADGNWQLVQGACRWFNHQPRRGRTQFKKKVFFCHFVTLVDNSSIYRSIRGISLNEDYFASISVEKI